MFRRPSGWSLHILPDRPIIRFHCFSSSPIGKKPDEAGCRAYDGYRTTSAHSMRFTRLANLPTVIAARITGNSDVMRLVRVADHSSGIAGLRDTRETSKSGWPNV